MYGKNRSLSYFVSSQYPYLATNKHLDCNSRDAHKFSGLAVPELCLWFSSSKSVRR